MARAVHLNGTNQSLAVATELSRLDDFTVEAWVRTATGGPVIGTWSPRMAAAIDLGIAADGAISFWTPAHLSPDGYVTHSAYVTTKATEATDGEWHHIAAVRQGAGLTVYLDGAAQEPARAVTPTAPWAALDSQRLQFGTTKTDALTAGPQSRAYFNGEFADIRVWNRARTDVEIPAGLHHQIDDTDPDLLGHWAFTNDDGHDSSLGRRDATFVNNPAFLDSDVEIVPQGDFYLITQARLIQDYTHNPNGIDAPEEIEGYRVTCNIRDFNDQGTPGFLTLALNNPDVTPTATLHFPDATSLTLSAANPQLHLPTDSQGVISFTLDAQGELACPMLRVQADFQTDGSWMVIAPDRQAHSTLSQISGNNLRGLDANGQPIPGKTSPLPSNVDGPTADATATAIAQMMGPAVQHNTQADQPQIRLLSDLAPTPTIRPYLPRYQLAGIVATGHDTVTDAIATHHVDQDTPVARVLNPCNADHAHWGFNFKTFTPHNTESAARQISNLNSLSPTGDLAHNLLPDFGPGHITGQTRAVVTSTTYAHATEHDILTTTAATSNWLKDHVKAAARILVNAVPVTIRDEITGIEKEVTHLVVTAVDAAEHAVYAVIQAVEHAVDVVAGFLERLGSDIKKIVSFLKALFNWQDVRNTQRIMHSYINNLEPYFVQVISDGADLALGSLAGLKKNIDAHITQWRDHLIRSGAQHTSNDSATAPPQDLQSTYAQTMTTSSFSSTGSSNSFKATTAQWSGLDPSVVVAPAEQLVDEWLLAIGNTWDHLPEQLRDSPIGTVHNIKSFFLDGLELMLSTVQALIDAVIGSLEDLIPPLKKYLHQIINALFSIGNQHIQIPFVTPFYEKIVMGNSGEKLSILSLASLLGAMPVTFTYKITHGGKAPYTAQEADAFVNLTSSDYTWLVDPFRQPNSTSDPNPQPEPPVNPVALDSVNICGAALLMVGATLSDGIFTAQTFPAADQPPLDWPLRNQLRYKWGTILDVKLWERFATALVVIGNILVSIGGAVNLNNSVKTGKSGEDRTYDALGMSTSVLAAFSATAGAVATKKWSTGDAICQSILAGCAVIPAIVMWERSDKRRQDDTMVAISILSFCANIGQFAKIWVPKTAAPGRYWLGGVITALDALGYLGTVCATAVLIAEDKGVVPPKATAVINRFAPAHSLPQFT
ncbi:LamG domain-containing protein [Streptomyces sp. NBC_00467]